MRTGRVGTGTTCCPCAALCKLIMVCTLLCDMDSATLQFPAQPCGTCCHSLVARHCRLLWGSATELFTETYGEYL